MQPLASARFHEAFQLQLVEKFAQLLGRRDHGRPRDIRRRIEIEDQPVGLFDGVDSRTPDMDFQGSDLRERHQAADIFNHAILRHAFLLPKADSP